MIKSARAAASLTDESIIPEFSLLVLVGGLAAKTPEYSDAISCTQVLADGVGDSGGSFGCMTYLSSMGIL